MSEKGALFRVTIQPFFFKNTYNLIEMILMLLLALRIDQNVIEVSYHKLSNLRPKHLIH